MVPSMMSRSVPHMPTTTGAISSSPAPGCGSGRCSSSTSCGRRTVSALIGVVPGEAGAAAQPHGDPVCGRTDVLRQPFAAAILDVVREPGGADRARDRAGVVGEGRRDAHHAQHVLLVVDRKPAVAHDLELGSQRLERSDGVGSAVRQTGVGRDLLGQIRGQRGQDRLARGARVR